MNQIDYAPYQFDYIGALVGTAAAAPALRNSLGIQRIPHKRRKPDNGTIRAVNTSPTIRPRDPWGSLS
jgi:hypothetical protein